jgi:adenylate cyclase
LDKFFYPDREKRIFHYAHAIRRLDRKRVAPMKIPENIELLAGVLHPGGSRLTKKDFVLRWKWRQSAGLIIASVALGLIYPVFGDGFGSIVPFINGFAIGFLGGISISAVELFLFSELKQKLSFLAFVLLKSLTYTIVITGFVFSVILVSRSFEYGLSIRDTLYGPVFQHFLYKEDFLIIVSYALVFALIVIFTREINVRLGQGVLQNLITGRFRKPGPERRIFLFIDLNSSVSKAERLGDMEYHRMLNDFFYDITDCILMSRGIIYQYVGDEVVVTWRMKIGLRPERCLEAFVSCMQKISRLENRYVNKFGFAPTFKAAIHCGEVIYGEIGRIKTEFVFHGDVVNTTSRLERICSERNEKLLISGDYYELLPYAVKNCFDKTESLKLRGKENALDVYRLREMEQTGSPASQQASRPVIQQTG